MNEVSSFVCLILILDSKSVKELTNDKKDFELIEIKKMV
jgi:hypothetical protein